MHAVWISDLTASPADAQALRSGWFVISTLRRFFPRSTAFLLQVGRVRPTRVLTPMNAVVNAASVIIEDDSSDIGRMFASSTSDLMADSSDGKITPILHIISQVVTCTSL
jgi:hypothetical protein